ncbi:hypothetical protein Sme01_09430 [Sphaerisporangium melleum]|uniref:Glycosyl transferase n=1 Tax=Sphaerisporangium melleum TaxID=321316 RepID=A0A917QT99_9ACTN|nr:MraY family glycosyltransferase [Sphaerisporangium melleum]GGK67518.1 hypothetical protein GCM10007964_08180 [Sphaerisporangium melleum]GII68467.1 hypothetical protein Sme01_09430 [Sphaerisporangium melleum]
MNHWTILSAVVAGLLLAAATTRPLGRLATRWDLIDHPTPRKAHSRPVPYLGGIAIMLGTVVPTLIWAGLWDYTTAVVLCAAIAVGLLGLIDDVVPLSPLTRLGVESVAATGVVLAGVRAPLTDGWLDAPFTVLWIVVITNSFNLLDNADGSLGAITLAGAGLLSITAIVSGELAVALLLASLCGAGLGFLPHNWAPARIFMGDSGSLFIGFVLASSAVVLTAEGDAAGVVAGLLLPTFVATVDTCVVMLSRARAGRPLLQGGTDHLSHRLNSLGLGKRLSALTLAATACAAGALQLAMALHLVTPAVTTAAAVVAAIVLVGLSHRARTTAVPSKQPPIGITERR